jgi:hypothetical protein
LKDNSPLHGNTSSNAQINSNTQSIESILAQKNNGAMIGEKMVTSAAPDIISSEKADIVGNCTNLNSSGTPNNNSSSLTLSNLKLQRKTSDKSVNSNDSMGANVSPKSDLRGFSPRAEPDSSELFDDGNGNVLDENGNVLNNDGFKTDVNFPQASNTTHVPFTSAVQQGLPPPGPSPGSTASTVNTLGQTQAQMQARIQVMPLTWSIWKKDCIKN